jgi:hypothetical protein
LPRTYLTRLRRWQSRAPAATQTLSRLLTSKLTATVEAAGFKPVDVEWGQSSEPVQGSELRFERESGDCIDEIHAWFGKYAAPRFQIRFSRRLKTNLREQLRCGQVVRHRSEYVHEWGKPFWFPTALWLETLSERSVNHVVRSIDQVVLFLETGRRGPNISLSMADTHVSILRKVLAALFDRSRHKTR